MAVAVRQNQFVDRDVRGSWSLDDGSLWPGGQERFGDDAVILFLGIGCAEDTAVDVDAAEADDGLSRGAMQAEGGIPPLALRLNV